MRAAIAQTTTGIDPAANAAMLAAHVRAAKAEGADILFTPEMSGLLDRDRARMMGHVRTEAEDPLLAAIRDEAARQGLWVHLGSLALRDEDPDSGFFVNRSLLIDSSGEIRARYDKIHLFDVDLPSGESYRESALYRAGDKAVVADTPWGRMGLSICYDLRFAELYQRLTEAGATLIAIPAAFTVPTGQAHWHILQRARAIEAGVHVVAAAQTGLHEDGRRTFGHSLVVDPWGRLLLDMDEAAGLDLIDIDLEEVRRVREKVPAIDHRRPIPSVGGGR